MTSRRLRPSRVLAALVVLAAIAATASIRFAAGRTPNDDESSDAREAAVRLLTVDASAGRMPSDVRERQRTYESGTADRRGLLATVWAPSALEQRVQDWEAGWASVVGDPSYLAYSDNRYVVTDWREVTRVPGGVRVVVRGHMEYQYSANRQWGASADGTQVLTLTRVDGDWRLVGEVVKNYNPS